MKRDKSMSKRGFSLIETLVVISILGVASVVVAQMVSLLLNAQTIYKNFEVAQETKGIISALLTDSEYCALSFNGATIGATLPDKIVSNVDLKTVDSTGALSATSIITSGYKKGNLTLNTIELWATQLLAPTRYLGEIRMRFIPDAGGVELVRSLPIFIQVSGTNLSSCSRVLMSPNDNMTNGIYSQDCDNFASTGWGTKSACIEDGRWHRVYSHSNTGAATYGTLATLTSHAARGASIKVQSTTAMSGLSLYYANCEDFGTYLGVGLCRTPSVNGIPTWGAGSTPTSVSVLASSQFWFTSGILLYSKDDPSPSAPYAPVAPQTVNIPMDWYIKY